MCVSTPYIGSDRTLKLIKDTKESLLVHITGESTGLREHIGKKEKEKEITF